MFGRPVGRGVVDDDHLERGIRHVEDRTATRHQLRVAIACRHDDRDERRPARRVELAETAMLRLLGRWLLTDVLEAVTTEMCPQPLAKLMLHRPHDHGWLEAPGRRGHLYASERSAVKCDEDLCPRPTISRQRADRLRQLDVNGQNRRDGSLRQFRHAAHDPLQRRLRPVFPTTHSCPLPPALALPDQVPPYPVAH
jgi:hypothetical protein